MFFNDWDGSIQAGGIRRASSSNDKVWGEPNKTTTVIPYGHAAAMNVDGGVKTFGAVTDVFEGIVVRDIYAVGTPHEKIQNIGHFSHGDSVAVEFVAGQTFTRGAKAYVVCTGANAGKFTATAAATTIDVGFIVDEISTQGNVIVVKKGYSQVAGA